MTSANLSKVSSEHRMAALNSENSESDSLFRTYVETASDIVYTLDLTGKFTFVNSYGLKLIGAERYEDVVGHSYLDIVAPEYKKATFAVFAQLLKSGELRDYEFAVLTTEGDRVFLEVNGRLLYRSGRLVGALGIGRDITERKRTEAQLKMFSKALDSAYDSAIITDLTGNIQYANLATLRLFGWPASRLTGVNLSTFFPKQEQVDWLLEQAQGAGWSGQIVCQRYDGNSFSAFISVSPVYGEGKNKEKATSVSIILRDITQQEQIEAELAAKNLELARANRLKSEFLANMSHELRTPMTSILGFSKLLSQSVYGELNDRQQLYVDQIHQSGEHLLTLINEVLDLSKVEAGQMDLNVSEIHVATLCREVVQMVETQSDMKELTVHCDVPDDLPTLMADEIRVRQMLLNLLSNAIKFTPKGQTIGIRVERSADDINLTVWDEGIGIADADLASLFQPFQQLESSLAKQYEGTGLGLALTQKLTRLHGGDVTVRSEPNRGSEFTLHLPINCRAVTPRDEEHAVQDATLSESAIASLSPQSRQTSILVVEDNPINALLLEHMLTHWGYSVYHCSNGQDALNWLSEHHPALILMDLQLPGIDGLELTQQIRQQPAWQDIPIVAITALARPQDRDRALAAGMQDHLSKPINQAALVSILAKYTCGQEFTGA